MSRSHSSRSRTSARLRPAASALLLAGTLAVTAACGMESDTGSAAPAPSSSSPSSSSPSSSTASEPAAPSAPESAVQTITATEEDFSISVDQDSVPAGSYEIEALNSGGASHNLIVERDGEDVAATEILSPGGSETLTVDLEPGEYVFYCSVGAHRSMGMEITIEVT
ncbi:cupredoxin domain-containing protein [Blastococcus saxobsidens]|uniref:Plastocyanin n=1 Tax=Blastococcus saxobsidens TaxID=138336 RepID=A0A4Q7Y6G0_9ACTN|nr:plastocyanin/azurin family copper-binding protein [Blastococcus saxobsidens]RZU32552.1 plastocyanin [Blastococcus saxobsidens]